MYVTLPPVCVRVVIEAEVCADPVLRVMSTVPAVLSDPILNPVNCVIPAVNEHPLCTVNAVSVMLPEVPSAILKELPDARLTALLRNVTVLVLAVMNRPDELSAILPLPKDAIAAPMT